MNLNVVVELFLTVICTQITASSNSKLTRSPQIQIGILDFTHNFPDSSNNRYTVSSIPEYKLNFYLRPISANSYSFARETSFLKYRLLGKLSTFENNFFQNFSLKDSFWVRLYTNDLNDTSNYGMGRFREYMKYNLYSYNQPLDSFQITNQQGQSIDYLMNELSEYRNNTALYTIEKCDLKHFYYDTVNSRYRPNLMTYTGSVVGLSMLSTASHHLNSQIHKQMKRNNGTFNWKDIQWGKIIASGVASGLSSAYVIQVDKRGTPAGSNTFGGRVARKLVTNTIEMGAQSIGLLYDSRQHGFDYAEAQKLAFLNQALKMGSSGMKALVYRYLFRSTWDPWFKHFRKQIHGFDLHKDIHNNYNRDTQLKKLFDLPRSNSFESDFPDTVSVTPLIDFGWPILGIGEEKPKEFFIPPKKENYFME